MIFFTIYGAVVLVTIVIAIYMDVDHFKAYKKLPSDPNLLVGLVVGTFWPFLFILFLLILIVSGFSVVYKNLISFFAK